MNANCSSLTKNIKILCAANGSTSTITELHIVRVTMEVQLGCGCTHAVGAVPGEIVLRHQPIGPSYLNWKLGLLDRPPHIEFDRCPGGAPSKSGWILPKS
jgi:hypothetical protein